jgi:spermidine synthase
LSYYHSAGPFGQVVKGLNYSRRLKSAGVIGLGIGTIACYMQEGQSLTFFEIDPVVEDIARNRDYFSYLHHCGENVDVIIGDGRRTLARVPDNSFDLLLLDAFSSDAVPVHLLTREALAMYVDKLSDHGILMFNISNRYVDLAPVLSRLAEDANLLTLRQNFMPSKKQIDQGALDSEWIIMARSAEDMAAYKADARWQSIDQLAEQGLWTDDYSNLFRALVWHRLLWMR